MERFVKGDVVVVPFPFSDLTTVKRRPAFVVAAPGGDDIILCQITSQQVRDRYAISISEPISPRARSEKGAISGQTDFFPQMPVLFCIGPATSMIRRYYRSSPGSSRSFRRDNPG